MPPIDWAYEMEMFFKSAFLMCTIFVGLSALIPLYYLYTTRGGDWHDRLQAKWDLERKLYRDGFSCWDAEKRAKDVIYHNGVNTKWLMTR